MTEFLALDGEMGAIKVEMASFKMHLWLTDSQIPVTQKLDPIFLFPCGPSILK